MYLVFPSDELLLYYMDKLYSKQSLAVCSVCDKYQLVCTLCK